MGEIISAPFRYRKELEPLDERDQELVRFLTEDPPEDENILQRNYRLNRLQEFEELVEELTKPKPKKKL